MELAPTVMNYFKEIKMHILQQLSQQSIYKATNYSGRGMHGKSCLGFQVESGVSVGEFIADMMDEAASSTEGDRSLFAFHIEAMAEAFRDMKTDSLGRGTIVYFPSVDFEAEEGETDEDSVG